MNDFSPFAIEDTEEALPVELLNFTAKRKDLSLVHLDWTTALEINNSGFVIERMLDIEFQFQDIGWIDGQGSTTKKSYYSFEDFNGHQGISYYRLKQVDTDGSFIYSKIKAVEGGSLSNNGSLNIFPNPTTGTVIISLDEVVSIKTNYRIELIDLGGRVIKQYQKSLRKGEQRILLDDLDDLLSGAYSVAITSDRGLTMIRKLIKVE